MNFWKFVWKWSVLHSIHSGHTLCYCSQLSPHYGILFISIIKFCYYISLQNLWLICPVDSAKFMGHPKPQILNLSKYFAVNELLLHIKSAGTLITYQYTELCIPWQSQSMLNTARAHFCKLQEEIMHINYQLLPTETIRTVATVRIGNSVQWYSDMVESNRIPVPHILKYRANAVFIHHVTSNRLSFFINQHIEM